MLANKLTNQPTTLPYSKPEDKQTLMFRRGKRDSKEGVTGLTVSGEDERTILPATAFSLPRPFPIGHPEQQPYKRPDTD
jgi:hypothetical protein